MMTTTTGPTQASKSVEDWLDRRMIQWELVEVGTDEIDRRASRSNQARVCAIDEALVDQYRVALQGGAIFPAGFGWRVGDRYVLGDGNHRDEAFVRDEVERYLLYVVKVNPTVALALTYEANTHNGRPPTDEERLMHAVHLVDTGAAKTTVEAAERVGLRPSAVTIQRAKMQGQRRAVQLGVDRVWARVPEEIKKRLGHLNSDAAFVRLTRLATTNEFTTKEIGALIIRVRELHSDALRMDAIDSAINEKTLANAKAIVEKPATRAVGSHGATEPDHFLMMFLGGVVSMSIGDVRKSLRAKDLEYAQRVYDAARDAQMWIEDFLRNRP